MKTIFIKSKQFLLTVAFLTLGGASFGATGPVSLQVGFDDPVLTTNGHGKGTEQTLSLWQDDHVLTFESAHEDFTLCLFDEENNEVYSVFVPSSVSVVVLPATLTGNFKLMLIADTYYYYGYISL